MKRYSINILNDEYKVKVFLGKRKECIDELFKYWKVADYPQPRQFFENYFKGRGHCFYAEDLHPVIVVDGEMAHYDAIATLAHEATHAIQYIMEYIQMTDESGEFMGHGVGAIMRKVLKDILKNK